MIVLSSVFVGCEKDYCAPCTGQTGEPLCENCFRTQKQLNNFYEEMAATGKQCGDYCD